MCLHVFSLIQWIKLTDWRRAVVLMSFQSTRDDVSRINPAFKRRCLHPCDFLSVLEPDVGKTTSWTAAAVTLQLCLSIRLVDCYSGHLHLQSWIWEQETILLSLVLTEITDRCTHTTTQQLLFLELAVNISANTTVIITQTHDDPSFSTCSLFLNVLCWCFTSVCVHQYLWQSELYQVNYSSTQSFLLWIWSDTELNHSLSGQWFSEWSVLSLIQGPEHDLQTGSLH